MEDDTFWIIVKSKRTPLYTSGINKFEVNFKLDIMFTYSTYDTKQLSSGIVRVFLCDKKSIGYLKSIDRFE